MRIRYDGTVVVPEPPPTEVHPCVRCDEDVTVLTNKLHRWTGLCARCAYAANEKVEKKVVR